MGCKLLVLAGVRRRERARTGGLEAQEALAHLCNVGGVGSLVEINAEFGDGAGRVLFARVNLRQQQMDLRKAGPHVEISGLASALFGSVDAVEVEVSDGVVEVGLGVVERIEIE